MKLVLAVVAWGLAVGSGLATLHSYEATPGRPGVRRPRWPDGSRLRPEAGRPNLVLFAHPRCPCTRASLEELERVVDRCGGAVAAWVVFFRPGGSTDDWRPSGAWSRAEAIPGVRVVDDPGGVEAARFGAETSGHLALYGRDGALLYAGGITPGRGRVGDNPGSEQVIRAVSGGPACRAGAPVFGCPILGGPDPAEGARHDGR